MSDVTIIDPLGRSITLHDHTWYGHILKGHSEMANRRALAEKAIGSPVRICYSKSATECRLYFVDDTATALFVTIVADVTQGFVKTAYLSKSIKGNVEW